MALDPERIPVIAVAAMNDVHQHEARLLNSLLARLHRCAAEGGSWADLDGPLEELLRHMKTHFAAEEARMLAEGFAPYPVHKAEHDRMLVRAADAAGAWRERRDSAALQAFLERTLPDWLLQHISTMDAVTAQYLHARECATVGA